jgi:hypothetical protein
MATNPITSESLTVDFRSLMKIPVGDRAKAASISPDFLQSILNALTPIQIANAFPNYYKRQLPDVSNFVTSYITSRNGGNFNQTGGGNQGYEPTYHDQDNDVNGSARPAGSELSIKDMKEKLLEKGIDIDNTFGALEQGPILAGDERVQIIQNLSTDKLLEMGIEKYQDESGKDLFKLRPVAAESMTDEQIQTEMKKQADNQEGTYRPVYPLSDIDLSPGVINTIAGEALNNKESIDGVINNMLNRVGAQGDWTNLKDVARASGQYAGYRVASEEQAEVIKARIKEIASGKVASNIGAATEFRAEYYVKGEGYGKTFEREARKQGYKQPGPGDNIYAETFAAGPYAPRKAEEVEKIKTENAAKINTAFTPEEIKAYREQSIKEQRLKVKEDLIRETYQTPSPTSSEAIPDPEGRTVLESQDEIAGVRKKPITPELKEVLQYAGEESGVIVEVFSGGQNDITQGGPRKGTERHDLGHAADVKLKVRDADGKMRTLDSRNPEDRAIMSKFVETARMMGAKGIGSGLGYMGESGIHIGTVMRPDLDYSNKEYGAPAGKEAVWLSDKWTQEAFSRGQQAAVDFEKAGGMAKYRERREEKIAEQQKKESDKTVVAKQQEEVVQITEKSGAELLPESHPFSMTPEKKKRIIEAQNAKTETTTPESIPSLVETPVAETPPVVIESKETVVTETPPVVIESPVPVESKEVTVAAATPAEPKETTAATPPPPPEDVRKFALGGNIYEPNEDMTLVDTETGNPIAQIGNDEKIEKTSNAIQVTPETKLKADELTNKYDSSTEMEDRMSSIEDNMQNQKTPDTTNQIVQKAREPEKTQTETPHRWRESVASAERPISPSFNRAMARSKFFGEGHHFTRSAPSSQS